MSAEIILIASVLLQFAAAAVALRLASSLRSQAWLLVALAIFLMGLRRSLTLHGALALGKPVDAGAEMVALLISSLMLLGLWGLRQRSKEGEPLRLIGTQRDVTREKALEEQLRQAQKMEARRSAGRRRSAPLQQPAADHPEPHGARNGPDRGVE